MHYVYNRTSGEARLHLEARFPRSDVPVTDPFRSSDEMIAYLGEIYRDPYEANSARHDYDRLIMMKSESFPAFRTRFLQLANKAGIAQSDRYMDLYTKLTERLQLALVVPMVQYEGDFGRLCALAHGTDVEHRRIGQLRSTLAPLTDSRGKLVSLKTETQKSSAATPTTGRPTNAAPVSSFPRHASTGPSGPRQSTVPPRGTTPAVTSDTPRCYNCGSPNHLRPNCPHPQRPSAVNEIEEGEDEKVGEPMGADDDDDDSESSSGNGDA
jgi:hypothetical protein